MRKKLLTILMAILLIAATGLCLVACDKGDDTSLTVPQNVTVGGKGVVKWSYVEGAIGYEVKVNDNDKAQYCVGTSYNLLTFPELPKDGKFTVQVRSVNGDKHSDWSESVSYTHVPSKLYAPQLSFSDGILSWDAEPLAVKIILTINDTPQELAASETQYDLTSLQQDAVVGVKFVGDGLYALDSDFSYINYRAGASSLFLSKPTNVHMEGYLLKFDAVDNANTYYLQDVNDTITTISGTSSNRQDKYLVKYVWAADKNGKYEASERVEVQYFTEGTGTEEDPYLIGTAAELRFVEYYESTNQVKYFKLKNDIVLKEYAPAEEEEYNNFYNLGSLSGVIDGDGHKLVNSVCYFRDGYSSWFDSITQSGVIKNLIIDNANWRTWTNMTSDGIMHEKGGVCAILAYTNRGTIDNVTVTNSTVTAVKDGAAALVSINKGTISNCVVEESTTIYGANEAGGFAIFNSGRIERSVNHGAVGGQTTVGGIVGRNNGVVHQCGNEGTITATTYGGGIVGYNYNLYDEGLQFESTISECYNYGAINVVSFGGGIAGKNGGDGINEVGKMSYANAGIFSCYNTGAITGSNCLGGIVGDNYGYHEKTDDLGVVNCYSSGTISSESNDLQSVRVFLSFANCSWGTSDSPDFYMHYWGATGSSTWPGVRMTMTEVGGATYFYADMSITAEELDGIIFNRCDPVTGAIWNQSADITGKFTTGNLQFKIDSSWQTATTASSLALVGGTAPTFGGIAGFSNMINDCYFLAATVNGHKLTAGVAQGTQYNKIQIDGTDVESSACEVDDNAALKNLTATLNAYADVWADGENAPILKWQMAKE